MSGGMKLYVRLLTGKTEELEVSSDETIDSLKSMIATYMGPTWKGFNLRVHYKSKMLKDGNTLNDYGIPDGAILHTAFNMGSDPNPSDKSKHDSAKRKAAAAAQAAAAAEEAITTRPAPLAESDWETAAGVAHSSVPPLQPLTYETMKGFVCSDDPECWFRARTTKKNYAEQESAAFREGLSLVEWLRKEISFLYDTILVKNNVIYELEKQLDPSMGIYD